jgi:hypothetical protein
MTRDVATLIETLSELWMAVVVATVILSPLILSAWVLRPLDRMARRKKVRFQFMLVDFFSLVLLIQIPLAVRAAMAKDSPFGPAVEFSWIVTGIFCFVSALIWWTGVRTFGQAGIQGPRARAILGLLVLSLSYFGSLFAVRLIFSLGTNPKGWQMISLALVAISMICAGGYTRRLTTC